CSARLLRSSKIRAKRNVNDMGFFSKLFKKENSSPPQSAAGSAAAQADPRQDPSLIQIYDQYGRELYLTREQWRQDILPGSLKSNWNNVEVLYNLIVTSLNDGFAAEVLDAGEQLYRLESDSVRGTCIYAI